MKYIITTLKFIGILLLSFGFWYLVFSSFTGFEILKWGNLTKVSYLFLSFLTFGETLKDES